MVIYSCPVCGKQSVYWDTRSRAFLCNFSKCRHSFGPPRLHELSPREVIVGLGSNHINVTRSWVEGVVSDKPVVIMQANSSTDGAEFLGVLGGRNERQIVESAHFHDTNENRLEVSNGSSYTT